jgi:Tfp pilus assembly protein FimV
LVNRLQKAAEKAQKKLSDEWEAKYRRDANDEFNRRVTEGKAEYDHMQEEIASSTARLAKLAAAAELMTKKSDISANRME